MSGRREVLRTEGGGAKRRGLTGHRRVWIYRERLGCSTVVGLQARE